MKNYYKPFIKIVEINSKFKLCTSIGEEQVAKNNYDDTGSDIFDIS